MSIDASGSYAATPELDGARADDALRKVLGASWRAARRVMAAGGVSIERAARRFVVDASDRIAAGDRIYVAAPPEPLAALGMAVLFEDERAIVVAKPPGLASHAGPLVDDSVADRLSHCVPGAGLAHRLDRDTSGALLCGKHADALRAFAADDAFLERAYLAIAAGSTPDRTTIDEPLLVTDEPMGDRPKVVVDREHGRPARTHLETLARARRASLVRLTLETGRTHQIRAHLKAAGHPLLGDPRYGEKDENARAAATYGIARTMLHAVRLGFVSGGEKVAVEAPLARDFARALAALRL